VQRETGITTLYVTHDQEEAFTMSDRVVVMNHGEIRQVGTPKDVYTRPSDSFVANFVGEVNLWPVTVESRASATTAATIAGAAPFTTQCGDEARGSDGNLMVAVRPERVWVWRPGEPAPRPEIQLVDSGVIVESTFLGNSHNVVVESDNLGRTTALLYDGEEPRDLGERVTLGWEAKHALTIPQ
jgi:ABC-type Fe3+/spermidine/putrescine transport system ATPase subunit